MRRKRRRRRSRIGDENDDDDDDINPRKRMKISHDDDIDMEIERITSSSVYNLGGPNSTYESEDESTNNIINTINFIRPEDRGNRRNDGNLDQNILGPGPGFERDGIIDDDENDMISYPASLFGSDYYNDDECVICNSNTKFSGSTKLSDRVHKTCGKIITNGIRRNQLSVAVENATNYANKFIIGPYNRYVRSNRDSKLKIVDPWTSEDVKRHYTECLSTPEFRSMRNIKIFQELVDQMIKYEVVYYKNDGQVNPETGKNEIVRHLKKDAVKLVSTLIKELTILEMKITKEYSKSTRRGNSRYGL